MLKSSAGDDSSGRLGHLLPSTIRAGYHDFCSPHERMRMPHVGGDGWS